MSAEDITWLAKKAAFSGLRLNQAQCLFDALYVADALAIEGGNVSAAAVRAEFGRTGINRMLRRTARTPAAAENEAFDK